MALSADFDRNVFINCPFDDGYKPMFDAIVFTVMGCGFIPRCALEVVDSGQVRIEKIVGLIAQCRLGIHDISNTELDKANGLPRFNMPLELGLFIGCARYGSRRQKDKTCLIFDRDPYRYQKFISDIAGQDIASHGADVGRLTKKIRDWLQPYAQATPLPGGAAISAKHAKFRDDLPAICNGLSLKESELTFQDLVHTIETYLTTPYGSP